MELDQAGIDLGKEVGAHLERKRDRAGDDGERHPRQEEAPVQQAFQRPAIEVAHPVEAPVEAVVEAAEVVAGAAGGVARLLAARIAEVLS